MIWVSRVLAAVVVVIGPAALVYARLDLGPWTPWSEGILLSVPFGFHALAAFGYVVATGVTRADASALRTSIAAVGCLVIPFATFALSLPLLFALGESGSADNQAVEAGVVAVLALPTAAFQVLVTGRPRTVSMLEFLSHPCAASGALLVTHVLSLPSANNMADRIFQGWPVLLALAPFVALAIAGATAVPLQRLAWGCVVAALPIYGGMIAFDIADGRGIKAALWPARVWTDFISGGEHLALIRAVTTIRAGVPVQIGEHRYRFARPTFRNAWPSRARRPDRIVFLQVDIPADDLDLPAMRIVGKDHVALEISTASRPFGGRSPEEMERGGAYVAIADRDLIVAVVAPRNRDIDRAAVRDKLRRFIRDARVEPTVSAVPQ